MCKGCVVRARHADPVWRAKWEARNLEGSRKQSAREGRSIAAKRRYADPAERAKMSAAKLAQYASDPDLKRRVAEAGAVNLRAWMADNPDYDWSKHNRERRDTRLAWCPPSRRDEYRRMTRHDHIPAAEARAIIEADERAKVRRKARDAAAARLAPTRGSL